MPSSDQMLQEGIAAARAGDRARAKSILAAVVQTDPASEQGWLWLGLCLTTSDQRDYCFRRVLTLNPRNVEARRALDQTQVRPDIPVVKSPPPLSRSVQAAPLTAPPKVNAPSLVQAPPLTTSPKVNAPAPVPASPPPLSRTFVLTVVAIGSVLALVTGGLGLGLLYMATHQPSAQVVAVAPTRTATPAVINTVQTLPTSTETPTPVPPTSTSTPLPTAAPATATPLPWPTTSPEKMATAQAGIAEAESLLQAGNTAGALARLNRVVAEAPNYSLAYYSRAYGLYLVTESHSIDTQDRPQIYQAVADAGQAIRLDPSVGDFYLMRFKIYEEIALIEPYRIDQDYWHTLALDDIRAANQLGNSEQYSDREPLFVLAALGRCQATLDEADQLTTALGPNASPSATLNYASALGYLCLNKPSEALKHIDLALKVDSSSDRQQERVVILYSLGRLDEALNQFDQNVTDYPDACECRYYLRALVDYELGSPIQAQADLQDAHDDLLVGRGVRAYLLGRLALDAGDTKQAIQWFQKAEAQLTRDYGPILLDRIHQQLDQLGASPLSPTLSVPLTATPQP